MTTNDLARQQLAQQRQQDEHVQDAMLERSSEEVHTPPAPTMTEEQAREQLAQQRQHDEHTQETMLARSEDEVTGASS